MITTKVFAEDLQEERRDFVERGLDFVERQPNNLALFVGVGFLLIAAWAVVAMIVLLFIRVMR